MRVAALAALLLLAGAGCFSECPHRVTGGTWTAPALFSAIEGEASLREPGLPVPGASVTRVVQAAPVAEGGAFILTPAGILLRIAGGIADDPVRAGLVRFLANVTTATDHAQYVDRFLDSRRTSGGDGPGQVDEFSGPLPDALDLRALFERTVGDQPAAAHMQGDGWQWRLVYPSKAMAVGPGELVVDAIGQATFEHRWDHGDQAAAEQDLREWMDQAGLPPPGDVRMHAGC